MNVVEKIFSGILEIDYGILIIIPVIVFLSVLNATVFNSKSHELEKGLVGGVVGGLLTFLILRWIITLG